MQQFFNYYPDVCLQLNMKHVELSGRPDRPRTQHDCHHDTKVKPEVATAVIELLKMGGKTPETCWAVNKRQDNKLENCCILLVIYLNYTMMHGFTNLKVTLLIWTLDMMPLYKERINNTYFSVYISSVLIFLLQE
jgi:hypothetical protein